MNTNERNDFGPGRESSVPVGDNSAPVEPEASLPSAAEDAPFSTDTTGEDDVLQEVEDGQSFHTTQEPQGDYAQKDRAASIVIPQEEGENRPPLVRKLIMRPVVFKDGYWYASAPLQPPPEKPLTPLGMIFGGTSQLIFFSITSLLVSVSWLLLYAYLLIERDAQFTSALRTMEAQGYTNYSVLFNSPLLTLLRVFMGLIPVCALGWAFSIAHASNHKKTIGKRPVVFLVLIVFLIVGIVSVFDIAGAGLVFDVIK